MDQWPAYPESSGSGSRRYNNGSSSSNKIERDYNGGGQPQQQQVPPLSQQYAGGNAVIINAQNSPGSPMVTGAPPPAHPIRDNNGDILMHDAAAAAAAAAAATPGHHDTYAGLKYPMRPHHQHNLSSSGVLGGGRSSGLQSPNEPSQAAQRYSPMEALSPVSPYSPYVPKSAQTSSSAAQYTPVGQQPQQQSLRQSPARPQDGPAPQSSPYHSQNPYYGGARQPPQSLPQQQQQQPPPILNLLSPGSDSYSPVSGGLSPMDTSYGDHKSSQRPQLPASGLGNNSGGSSISGGKPKSSHVPEFKSLKNITDLRPTVNSQPPFRRANPEGGFISPLQALTVHLPATYRICNPNFKYESSRNPRRVLTKPSKGLKNDGFDNEDSDYILYVNDILGSEEAGHKNRYLILDVLGQGTFGQVVKCQNLKTQEVVAVKVIKNKTAYFNQSMMEVSVLDLLNTKLDKNDDHHLLRLKDTFIHRQHLCLVFELLSVNLYELIKQNQFRGLSTTLVRVFAQQLLNGLALLNKARLIHCDLKPENILLKNLESPIIKIIDFGSACDERQTVYTYIQSRFYRSPEVLLGLPYSSAIDMWSLGCIVVELFLGLPLFPGSSEYNQVMRIVEMLGNPQNWMIEMGKQAGEFFERRADEFGRRTYQLKSMEQYSREHGTKEQPSKRYFQATTLPEIIKTYPMPRKNMKQSEIDREINNRIAFIDFVRGLLTINPLERWSPQQAKLHPFITQQKFTGPFIPPMNLKSSSLNRSPAPGTQQQQQAEAISKQRAQAAQAQANNAAQNAYAASAGQYQQQQQQAPPQSHHNRSGLPLYNTGNMYAASNSHVASQQHPPPYGAASQNPYSAMVMSQQGPPQMAPVGGYGANLTASQNPYQHQQPNSAGTARSRQRASTMEQQMSGIPAAIQRVASHLDPTQPIRLQPSPAYYPPPADGVGSVDHSGRPVRRGSRATHMGPGPSNMNPGANMGVGNMHGGSGMSGSGGNSARGGSSRDFIRNLEERTLEEGFLGGNGNTWH
ncbi:dual specificity protein kinase yak1 [Sporothrix epigloea]|uniref:Dual specificity protein kinase yak1 n=1 Tax=Sporothrix epigloea TaxID=1892477 RepID=A0ABP0E1T8_9PEZI